MAPHRVRMISPLSLSTTMRAAHCTYDSRWEMKRKKLNIMEPDIISISYLYFFWNSHFFLPLHIWLHQKIKINYIAQTFTIACCYLCKVHRIEKIEQLENNLLCYSIQNKEDFRIFFNLFI